MPAADVLIVGAGPSGLACARRLAESGRRPLVLEAGDRIGGRLGSRVIDDHVCDLGFQVSMSNYHRLEALVPRDSVPRHAFVPGAIVVTADRRFRVVDPAREPLSALGAWWNGLLGLPDLLGAVRARSAARRAMKGESPEGSARDWIASAGFTPRFVDAFLRPFFGGVMLDEELEVPAGRLLRTIHRFATGDAELPTGGMQALADGLAAPVREDIRLHTTVATVDPEGVTLHDGSRLDAGEIVVATPFDVAARLLSSIGEVTTTGRWSGTIAVHFSSPRPVLDEPIIVLNGRPHGELNLVCSPTSVAPSLAPEGRHTVLASLRPSTDLPETIDVASIRREAADLLGVPDDDWIHLATDRIPDALPRPDAEVAGRLPANIHLAGDWQVEPSIDEALAAGLAVADRILEGSAA